MGSILDKLLLLPALALLYALGGTLQLFGFLSITETNVIVLLLLVSWLSAYRMPVDAVSHGMLLAFLLYAWCVGVFLGDPASALAVYGYYVLCLMISFSAAQLLADKTPAGPAGLAVFRIAIGLLCLEAVVVVLQNIYVEDLRAASGFLIGAVDMIFGTFYMQSDSTLSMVSVLLLIASFSLRASIGVRALILALAWVVVLSCNSKAAQLYLAMVSPALVGVALCEYFSVRRVVIVVTGLLALAILLVLGLELFSTNIDVFLEKVRRGYAYRYHGHQAHRLAPMWEMLQGGNVPWHGLGLLTYYNPLSKEWLYDAGLSMYYSLYMDLGIVGLLFLGVYFVLMVFRFVNNVLYAAMYLGALLAFTAFNFAISDIGFFLVFFYLLLLHERHVDEPISRVAA